MLDWLLRVPAGLRYFWGWVTGSRRAVDRNGALIAVYLQNQSRFDYADLSRGDFARLPEGRRLCPQDFFRCSVVRNVFQEVLRAELASLGFSRSKVSGISFASPIEDYLDFLIYADPFEFVEGSKACRKLKSEFQ
ncbi:MAG: hypothetical protein ACYCOU_08190 [Sulfobacillus sp.]